MRLISPSVELWKPDKAADRQSYWVSIYKHIERCGRICYKSEMGDSVEFVSRLMAKGHLSPLEHGTVCLRVPENMGLCFFYNHYSTVIPGKEDWWLVVTNMRVLTEGGWLEKVTEYADCEYAPKRYTMHITCSRAIANEFVRHREFSFSQESTRYCNYSKEQFGKEITFIKPKWYQDGCIDTSPECLRKRLFDEICRMSERDYMEFLASGGTPQNARDLLPLCLKTELVMTGFITQWQRFVSLRCGKSAHPEARKIAEEITSILCDETGTTGIGQWKL